MPARTPGRTILSRHPSWLAALPLLLATGCANPDRSGNPPLGDAREAITENANDQTAFDFFLGRGLTPVQSAGIIGNLDQESGMDPTISQYGGGPGRGIAQWSAGGRWDSTPDANVLWYAGQQGESAYSLNLQLEFIWWELTNEGYGFSELEAATTTSAAVVAFQDDYEICGACDSSNRVAHADAALAQFGGDSAGPLYAAHYVSQSWPLASASPIQMTQYVIQTGSIDLKNTGNTTWPAGVVKLAPIPRDQASSFAAGTWLSATRVSTIAADVAPGETGHFEWDLEPQAAGDFAPYFGLVAEGVTWFADSGGPGDDVMQVNVHVAPAALPPPPMTTSSSAGAGGSGAGPSDGGGGASAGGGAPSSGDGGAGPSAHHEPTTHTSAASTTGSGKPTRSHPGSDDDATDDDATTSSDSGGCSLVSAPGPASSRGAFGLFAIALLATRRRRGSC